MVQVRRSRRLPGMTYRVTFAKRFQSDGEPSQINPAAELDQYLAEDVVADKSLLTSYDPDSKHSQGEMDEDDAFLGMAAPEVWEYEVMDEKKDEFEEAIRLSQVVMEFEVIDDASVSA